MLICIVRLIAHVVIATLVGDPFVSIEHAEEEQMFGQRSSHLDPARTGDVGRRRPERVRGVSSRHRRHRPGVECLEDRRLLSAVTEFPLPTNSSLSYSPNAALTAGPDGNLWFGVTAAAGPAIARITPAGTLTEFSLPAGYYGTPSSLTVGRDGDLWFTEDTAAGNVIARITPAGALTAFPVPGYGSGDLTVGRDGNLWFTELTGYITPSYLIGRITPAGAIAEFGLHAPHPGTLPVIEGDLTAGPDGNLWFPEDFEIFFGPGGSAGPAIGRITTVGAVTRFRLPAGHGAGDLTVGPDGNLWFIDGVVGRIGRVDLAPRVTKVVAVADSRGAITSILVSFDEALDPASVSKGRSYSLASGVERGQTIVFSQKVKVARVTYYRTAHTVRLRLAAPQKGPVRVTVRAGFVAADGMSSASDFTAVVT
jgi:streptogramin lyase